MLEPVKLPVGETHELWVVSSTRDDGNMGLKFGEREEVLTHRAELFARIGLVPTAVICMRTINGHEVKDIDRMELMPEDQRNGLPCDAIMTASPNKGLAIFPADCIPLVVFSHDKPVVSLIHGSRPSIEQDIHTRALNQMLETHELEIDGLEAFMGPSIMQESYGYPYLDESISENERWQGLIEVSSETGMYHLDLIGMVNRDLAKFGIAENRITQPTIDTGATDAPFFSHRRHHLTGEQAGRNGTVVVMRILDLSA